LFTFVDGRQQIILYFSGSMHAWLLKKASFPLDKHPAVSMVFGAIWALKKPS
jgi:hypothetical protein